MSSAPERSDAELVAGTLAGGAESYEQLVARYQGHVYALAYSLSGNWADAQDIAQETFIRAYSNLDQLRDPARFAAWLRRVAFGVGMNWIKAYRPRVFARLDGRVDLDKLEIPDFQPGPPEAAARRELAEAVMRAVRSLPAKYRVPLTMFHLDGLSYEKVAGFLDIPLGTAKSLIHRAQAKLKEALAAAVSLEEVGPMVQEVFDEHKLPPEFPRRVLDGIPEISYRRHECTFAGSLAACLEFMKRPAGYEFLMGVSGGAFKLLWCRTWCPSNNSMGVLGEEPIRRTFRALGLKYELVTKPQPEEVFRRVIIDSIGRGRPVVAYGIVGAPDEGIVTGYDRGGDVLLGRSYFHDSSKGYYEKADWYKDCCGAIVIGEAIEAPPARQVLREALEWAVQLARTSDSAELPGADKGRASGLAAYDEWAAALRRDEDFPAGNLKVLTSRCTVNRGVTLSGLWDARRAAAAFLRSQAGVAPEAEAVLREAAAFYDREAEGLVEGLRLAPLCTMPEDRRLKMADPALRRRVAEIVLAARDEEARAVDCLEQALRAMAGTSLAKRHDGPFRP